MNVVLTDLFGSLGGLLSLFIIGFICLMPLGIYWAIRRFEAQKAQEQAKPGR
ncbi:MAG: DUF3149 domain-containing protein [Gammaproteobacteria bacterium]|nr:DUF3149 domain-containing protein [Gammaproteobacteria bacterium]